jgi:UDP-2,3-diacylglucosamine pyrophosphatase LpxH
LSRCDNFTPIQADAVADFEPALVLFARRVGWMLLFNVMNQNGGSQPVRGVVLSDLHLFARRSQAAECVQRLRAELATVRVLVLNGDIFDFRWSTLRDVETTMTAALDWFRELATALPQCEIHYVIGNHDCHSHFRQRVEDLASMLSRLHCHEQGVRLAGALFLHGDCADAKMDPPRLRRQRARWEHYQQRGVVATSTYIAADRLGLTSLVQARQFPRHETVERVAHYLDCAWPEWRGIIRDCYFGHTHLPFSNHQHDGVAFHNTGSAIRGMGFNPIIFETHSPHAESLLTLNHDECTR